MRCKEGQHRQVILNDSWTVNLRSTKKKKKKPLKAEFGSHQQVRLNPSHLPSGFEKAYVDGCHTWNAFFNKTTFRKKQMFTDYEMKYLIETNDRDLVAMDSAIQTLVNNLAKNGKELAILQEKRAVMFSIKQTLDEEKKESESEADNV